MVDKEVNKHPGPVNRGKMKTGSGKIEKSRIPDVKKDSLQKPSGELKYIEKNSSIIADQKVKPETKVPHNRGVHYGGMYEVKGRGRYFAKSAEHALQLAGLDSGKCERIGDGVGKFGRYDISAKKDYELEPYDSERF